MDKRLIVYEHYKYYEDDDTWYHFLEYDYINGRDYQMLLKVQDFLEAHTNLKEEFYNIVSITRIPLSQAGH